MPTVDTPAEVDTAQEQLSQKESRLLQSSLERGLEDTRSEATEVLVEKVREYMDEIQVAASIARSQFDQKFGGLNPKSGRFAVSRPRAGYFGYDSWEGNLNSLTSGSTSTWLNDGAPDNLGGTDTTFGNPLKVGEEAVHIIFGVGTYSPSPKISAFEFELNEEPRSTVNVKYEWTRTDTGIKWLDRPMVLPENALVEAQVYADNDGADAPYPVGLSFIESRASQILDPSNMTDDSQSTQDNIVAQG